MRSRCWSVWVVLALLTASVAPGCGDGVHDDAGDSASAAADSGNGLDGLLGDSALSDAQEVTGDASVPDIQPDGQPSDAADTAAAAKLEITEPLPTAVVNPNATLKIRAKLTPAEAAALEYSVTDDDGAVVASGDVTDTNNIASDLPAPAKPGTHKWKLTVKNKATGAVVATADIVFQVNALPTAPGVSIQPQPASAKDGLQAKIDTPSTDADGQAVTYSYVWTKDGQPTGDTGANLPVGKAKKGEVWSVTVVASDGVGQSAPTTVSITVGNAAPEPAALAPLAATVGLEGSITATEAGPATDIDGDALTLTWVWTVDGQEVKGITGPTASVAQLAAALGKPIAVGAVVGVSQKVSDGQATASSAESKVTVGQGTACATLTLLPHVICTENGTTAPDLSCDKQTLGNGIICLTISGLPQDSTPVVASTATTAVGLTSDGTEAVGPFDVEVTDETGKIVGSASFPSISSGQVVQAKPATPGVNHLTVVVKKDGKIIGSWTSDVYLNTPPTAPEVAIQPSPAQAGEALVAKITGPSQDVDSALSQPITYAYAWTVNGKATVYTGDTVPAGIAKKGEQWQVSATPSDGVEPGPAGTAVVTIGNAPPKTPVLSVDSAQVGLLGTVKVTIAEPQAVDSDGEPVTTTLTWKVDGVVVSGVTGSIASVQDLAKAGAKIQVGSVISVVATATDGASQVSSLPVTVAVVDSDLICGSKNSPCAVATQCTENGSFAPKCECKSPLVGNGVVCMSANFPSVGIAGEATQVQVSVNVGSGAQGPLVAQLIDADGKVLASGQVTNGKVDLSGSLLTGTQGWTIQIKDAAGSVVAKQTASVFADTPPSAPVVTLGPAQATVQSGVQVVEVKATDVDQGQTLTYSFQWLKDGKPTGLVASELAPGVAKKGEVWTLIAIADDGYAAGLPGQATILIGNAAPSDFKAVLPAKIGLLSTLTVQAVPAAKSDVDGDPLTYTAQWWVNNEEVVGETALSLNLPKIKLPGGKILKAGAKIVCVVSCSDGSIAIFATSEPCVVEGEGADVCKSFNPCDKNALCINNGTLSPDCACNVGYSGDGLTCKDVDECLSNNGGCDPNAACKNTVGANTCACKAGFTGDGNTCVDVNECLVSNGGCNVNAACTNVPGSLTCACKAGYSGDGKTCTDVNE